MPTATICCVVSSHSILFTFVITLVEFGTARHVIPPSVEVESDVVEAASSEVMGRVEVGRVVGVMVSAEDYEAMRQFYANRLQHTLAISSAQSEQAGMTPQALQELLRDES